MKKKHFAKIALALAMIQLLVVCSVFSTSAAIVLDRAGKFNRSYEIYKTDADIAVDGIVSDGEWDNLPWSDSFVCTHDETNGPSENIFAYRPEFDAKYKATWKDLGNNVIMLYVMVQVEGDTTISEAVDDQFRIIVGDSDAKGQENAFFRCWTGYSGLNSSPTDGNGSIFKNAEGNITTFSNMNGIGLSAYNTATDKVGVVGGTLSNGGFSGGTGGEWAKHTYCYANHRDANGDGTIVIEYQRKFDTRILSTDNGFGLDITLKDGMTLSGKNNYAFYSWAGNVHTFNQYSALGKVTLVDDTYTDPLAGVSVVMNEGASIRLDTADETMSGIRFATTVTVPEGVSIVKTGTLIIPTEKLQWKWCSITDSNFNKDVLKTIGGTWTNGNSAPQAIVEGTNYYDLENVDNEWIDGTSGGTGGTWYGVLYGIQEANYGRKISAVGYAVVEVDGVEYTVYADYDHTQQARSIKDVAQLALNAGIYTETSNEYAQLQKFIGAN